MKGDRGLGVVAGSVGPVRCATVAPMPKATSTPSDHPRPRDADATRDRLLQAVGEVLARDGFTGIGVNAVARQAGVDKVLLYRYFGGLPGLLEAWSRSGRFWPPLEELLGDDPAAFLALPLHERWSRFFEHFIDGLRARPLTVEVLAAEVIERNELTAVLEAEREAWGEQAERVLGGPAFVQRPALRGLTLVLVAGVQHLLVRARKIRVFGGIDLQTDEGWSVLKASVRGAAQVLFAEVDDDPPPAAAPAQAGRRPAPRARKA